MGIKIRSVNQRNLKQEFELIKTTLSAASKTNRRFLSVDTEFPGIVVQKTPDPDSPKNKDGSDLNQARYDVMRESVKNTKLIQLGLTVYDADKRLKGVWEFNFKGFDKDNDECNHESINFLQRHGVNFDKNQEEGIMVEDFAEELMNLLNHARNMYLDLIWVFFHCTYDLGYLVKILFLAIFKEQPRPLPGTAETFINTVRCLLGNNVFDLKEMVDDRKLGLDKLAENLKVERIGQSHQAGSDSLLTLDCFVALFEPLRTEPEKAKKLWDDCQFKLHGFDGIKPPLPPPPQPLAPQPANRMFTNFEVQQQYNSSLLAGLKINPRPVSQYSFSENGYPRLQNNFGPTKHPLLPPPDYQSFKPSPENRMHVNFEVQQQNKSSLQTSLAANFQTSPSLPLQDSSNTLAGLQNNPVSKYSYAGSQNDFPDLQNNFGRTMHPQIGSFRQGAPKSNSKKKQAADPPGFADANVSVYPPPRSCNNYVNQMVRSQ